MVGGTREAKVVGSNSGNGGKNRTRAYSRKNRLCDDIGDGLILILVTFVMT